MRRLFSEAWFLIRQSVQSFIDDNALSHGAAMAFYAATSLAPILLIVVAIAGLVFGHEAAELALSAQISGLMGAQSAELLRAVLQSAAQETSGTVATIVGVAALFVTASGVFGEMQLALNMIWKAEPKGTSLSRLVRARAASLGLVAALGFLLLVSLITSAAIAALADIINAYLPFGTTILSALNALVSFAIISVMFGAIYKVLPDRSLKWRDVMLGAIITAALFTLGKSLIGWYIGTSTVASSYGAAGGLLVTLLWVYYTSEIFLLGAEFTRAYSIRYGSRPDLIVLDKPSLASTATGRPRQAFPATVLLLLATAWTSAALTLAWLHSRRS